jgi:exodeoxyribonuclease V alpha subunit
MSAQLQEITATYLRERHRFNGAAGDTIIGEALVSRTVGDVTTNEQIAVKGLADSDGPLPHQVYRFFGHWQAYRNPRTGQSENQFHFRTFVRNTPHSRAGIIGYLDKAPGIGSKIAGYLYDKFNSSAVTILRTQPEVAACAIPRLTLAAAEGAALWLEEQKLLEDCTIELIDLLEGRGFRKSISKDAVKRWGNRAPEIIRNNPYALGRFSGAGFKLCDKLYLELGKPPAAMRRQARCIAHAIKDSARSGDTWHYIGVAERALNNSIGGADVDCKKAARLATRAGLIASTFTNGQDGEPCWDGNIQWVADADKARSESELARLVAEANAEPPWPIEPLFESPITDHQANEITKAIGGGAIGILGGRPGTGKTFTTAKLIKLIIEKFGIDSIVAVGPTGKSAVRMTEALAANGLNIKARTIHTTLGVCGDGDDDDWQFEFNEDNPLPFKFIVCDETSMDDTDILCSLMKARDVGTYVLLIGDVNQLPPVGHGAPLRDLITAGLPYGELREIHRNDGGIVQACADMADGKVFKCGGNLIERDPYSEESFDSNPSVTSDIYAAGQIQQMLITLDRMAGGGLNPTWDCQVLVPVNENSPLSRSEINRILQGHLNTKHPAIDGSPFRLMDKVVNLKNKRYISAGTEKLPDGTPKKIPVANGEVGYIAAIHDSHFEIKLPGERLIRLPRKAATTNASGESEPDESTGSVSHWDLAYALSVHKFQGSEASYAIALIDEYPGARGVCSREYWYTAISRAKVACFLIGKLATAQNDCRRVVINKRKTFLTHLLTQQITKLREKSTQCVLIESADPIPIKEDFQCPLQLSQC